MIYVDDLFVRVALGGQAYSLGRQHGHRWCHMFSDLPGEKGDAELIQFAQQLGMRREWFQRHHLGNHFDLTPPRRAAAVLRGAKEVSARDGVHIRRAARGAQPVASSAKAVP